MENNNLEKEYWGKSFYGSKLNTVLLLILIVLMIFALRFMYQNQGEYLPDLSTDELSEQSTQKEDDTYTYSKYGFSIELPKGFVPQEQESEGGPAISINLPQGGLSYISDATWWEKYNFQDFKYLRDEKIGNTTFKVYSYNSDIHYWFKQGNSGYEFSGNVDRELLETFKLVRREENQVLKEYKNDELGFSFKYPSYMGEVSFLSGKGDTGETFSGLINYSFSLYFAGNSRNYTAPEDGNFGRTGVENCGTFLTKSDYPDTKAFSRNTNSGQGYAYNIFTPEDGKKGFHNFDRGIAAYFTLKSGNKRFPCLGISSSGDNMLSDEEFLKITDSVKIY